MTNLVLRSWYPLQKRRHENLLLFIILFPFSCDEVYWRSFKDEGLADLIFQETQVREVHQFFFVYKDNKGRWFGCRLSRIEDFEAFPFVCRCRVDGNSIHNHIIQDS